MKKYRNYEAPDGWNYAMNYADVMQLRSAYNAGVKTDETKEASRIYIEWRRIKRGLKKVE
jgi:hypothetical protein